MPHKETAVRCCDDLDPIARVISRHIHFSCHFIGFLKAARVTSGKKKYHFPQDIGAINTIVRRPDGKLVGYNTDYVGAIAAIEDAIRGLYISLLSSGILIGIQSNGPLDQ